MAEVPLVQATETWVQKLENLGKHGVTLVLTGLVGVLVVIVMASYAEVESKVTSLKAYIQNHANLGKVYQNTQYGKGDSTAAGGPYDANLMEALLVNALDELRKNIKVVANDAFYGWSVTEQLKAFPTYTSVLKFVQYASATNQDGTSAIHKVLIKRYGEKYATSPLLVYNVPASTDAYTTLTFKHSLLQDLVKAYAIYKGNKVDIDRLLQ